MMRFERLLKSGYAGHRESTVTARFVAVAILIIALLPTAGCGGEATRDSPSAPTDTSTAEATPSAPADTSTGEVTPSAPPDTSTGDLSRSAQDAAGAETPTSADEASEWGTAAVRVRRAVSSVPVVSGLRAGTHDEHDRFVVEFRGAVPGYTLRYLDEPAVECGSGDAVELDGAVLELHLEPARGYADDGTATVQHGERSFGFDALNEFEVSCDFEAVFTTVLGVEERLPFRIQEFSNPARLVIDIRHPGA